MIACDLDVAMPVRHVRQTVSEAVALAHHLHGWVFHRLAAFDPALAAYVHDSRVRPFSLAVTSTDPDATRFRLVSLDGRLGPFFESLVGKGVERAQLGGPTFEVRPRPGPDGALTPEVLGRAPDPGEAITFEFLTPTSFRRQGLQIVFPLPLNVFGSLVERWNGLLVATAAASPSRMTAPSSPVRPVPVLLDGRGRNGRTTSTRPTR